MTPVHVFPPLCVFSLEVFKRLWKPKMTPVHVFAALCVLSLEAFTRFRFGSLFTSPVCFSEKPSKTRAKMIFYSKMIEKIEKCPYFSIKNGILLVFFLNLWDVVFYSRMWDIVFFLSLWDIVFLLSKTCWNLIKSEKPSKTWAKNRAPAKIEHTIPYIPYHTYIGFVNFTCRVFSCFLCVLNSTFFCGQTLWKS